MGRDRFTVPLEKRGQEFKIPRQIPWGKAGVSAAFSAVKLKICGTFLQVFHPPCRGYDNYLHEGALFTLSFAVTN